MKKILLVLLAISIFSCKNKSEQGPTSTVIHATIQASKELDFKVLTPVCLKIL